MGVEFRDTNESLDAALRQAAAQIQGDKVSLKDLLTLLGEQGLLVVCIVLTTPFLLPVSIPGVSTVFGVVIILIGLGVTLNRVPWLPSRLLNRTFQSEQITAVLEKAASLFSRLDRWLHPRLTALTTGPVINRLNGATLTAAGILLLFPLSFLPFSNTLPSIAILFLCIGILQRDGLFIVGGYVAVVVSVIYFAIFALLVIAGGQTLILG